MDCDMSLPGGDNFYDVTQVFADAAAGKPPIRLPLYPLIYLGASRHAFRRTRPSKRL